MLITASLVVTVDHLLRGMFWPRSIFGVSLTSEWRWLEHAGWVIFEDVFLILSCVRGVEEMRSIAVRQAQLEDTQTRIEETVQQRTAELAATNQTLHREVATRQWAESQLQLAHDNLERIVQERTEALRESQSRLLAIWQSEPECVKCHNRECIIDAMNPAGLAMIDADSEDQVVGKSALLLVDPPYHKQFQDLTDRVFNGESGRLEFSITGLKGSHRWLETHAVPLRDGHGEIRSVLALTRDITERRQAEQTQAALQAQLRQAQKMEAIGHLAGGIAHDFNNILTIINGQAETLFGSLRANFEACQRVQEIAKAGDRAAQLTRQLLAFSRQQILRPKVLDLNDLVTDFKRMLGRLIGEHITLTTKLSPDLGKVKVDPGQIEQVLMNLAVNARDAMPKGGRLSIETTNVQLDENYAQAHPEAKLGRFAMFAVSDTGCGMDKETMARIFEPFFTTKAAGKGTGLGLATTYGIVKQSGGFIYVYSEAGQGTCFKIYLPVTEESPSVVIAKPKTDAPTGHEIVLLVEDEEGVRALLRGTLEKNGYTVLDAGNGKEAMDISRAAARPIDLLLTDVVMPVMGGRELVEQFTPLHPAAKRIFMSGYTDDMVVRHGVHESEVEFLQKPFTLAAMLVKLRAVLDQGKMSNGTLRSNELEQIIR